MCVLGLSQILQSLELYKKTDACTKSEKKKIIELKDPSVLLMFASDMWYLANTCLVVYFSLNFGKIVELHIAASLCAVSLI